MKSLNVKRATSVALLSTLIASLSACGTRSDFNSDLGLEDSIQTSTVRRTVDGHAAKWTIAIHMAADNNLYTAGLDDINEMEAGLSSPDVNVIVLFDGAKQGDSRVYKIKSDKSYDKNIVSEVIDDKGVLIPSSKEIDSGDPKVFAKFSDWVTKNYPAENNMIAIWNHGDGIFRSNPAGTFGNIISRVKSGKGVVNRGFASDDNGSAMQLSDLNPALALAKQNLGKNLDILGFDTCLMGHLETAYQVKDQANYLVASEELEPGDGWDYHAWIKAISANPSMTPAQTASSLVDTYGKSYAPGGSQSGSAVTLSAFDINAMTTGLVPAINEFAAELTSNLASLKPTLTSVRTKTQVFYNRDAADLGDFLNKFKAEAPSSSNVVKAADRVRQELTRTVIRETHSGKVTRGSVANATGMVIYFPNSTMSYNPKYDNASAIRFAEEKGWGTFLKAFTKK